MKQKDRKLIMKIFSQISKLTYSELKSQFKREYEKKLKIDTEYSNDLNIEGRLERQQHITNLEGKTAGLQQKVTSLHPAISS